VGGAAAVQDLNCCGALQEFDWKAWVALAGVVISLVWNLVNTSRNNRVDRLSQRTATAIRFETVYGVTIAAALQELSDFVRVVRQTRDEAGSIEQVVADLKDLRRRLIGVTYTFAQDLGAIADSNLSTQPDEWRKLALFNWDDIISTYDAVRQSTTLEKCSGGLSQLESDLTSVRAELLDLRARENSVL